MITGFARAGQALSEPSYIERATKAADFLHQHAYNETSGTLLRTVYNGPQGKAVQMYVDNSDVCLNPGSDLNFTLLLHFVFVWAQQAWDIYFVESQWGDCKSDKLAISSQHGQKLSTGFKYFHHIWRGYLFFIFLCLQCLSHRRVLWRLCLPDPWSARSLRGLTVSSLAGVGSSAADHTATTVLGSEGCWLLPRLGKGWVHCAAHEGR